MHSAKMTMPDNLRIEVKDLFQKNRDWAAAKVAQDEDFFRKLVAQQAPQFLWIGCSDSRVPANDIVGLAPGELFVHRNIANVVVYTDLNCLSVIQFAVDVLKVKHIIVCGHYGCSGVHAALAHNRVGLADNWLRHVQDVHQKHEQYLGDLLPSRARQDRMCELNVIEQTANVCHTTVVQDAWDKGQKLTVHGWIYGLKDGLLRDLEMSINAPEQLQDKKTAALRRYQSV